MVNPLAMPFKLNFSPNTAFALTNHALIRVQGTDARSFLQSQCMNDVNLLGDGDWQYNGWLNPQGRLMALFYLTQVAKDSFWIILPELPAEPLIASLQRFKFRSKLSLSLDTDFHVNGLFLPVNSRQPLSGGDANGQTGLSLHIPGRLTDRILRIEPTSAGSEPEALDLWHCLDMQAGWIWLSEPLQNRWTPQMLSLDRLNAYSLKKGCYPGQEIVARTHYLGKSKRRLQSVTGTGLQIDQPLTANGRESGIIANTNATGSFGLAVVASDASAGPWLNASGEAVYPTAD